MTERRPVGERVARIEAVVEGLAEQVRAGFDLSSRQHHQLGDALHGRISKLREELSSDMRDIAAKIGPALERGAVYGDALARHGPRLDALERDMADRYETARRWRWLRGKAAWVWAGLSALAAAIATWGPQVMALLRHTPNVPPGPQ